MAARLRELRENWRLLGITLLRAAGGEGYTDAQVDTEATALQAVERLYAVAEPFNIGPRERGETGRLLLSDSPNGPWWEAVHETEYVHSSPGVEGGYRHTVMYAGIVPEGFTPRFYRAGFRPEAECRSRLQAARESLKSITGGFM